MGEKWSNWTWMTANPIVHWWFKILMMGVFLGVLIVWGIDGLNNISNFHQEFVVKKISSPQIQNPNFNSSLTQPQFGNPILMSRSNGSSILPRIENPKSTSRSNGSSILPQIENPKSTSRSNGSSILPQIENPKSTSRSNGSSILPQIENPNLDSAPNRSRETPSSNPSFTNLSWVSSEFGANYSSNLLAKLVTPGGVPCKDSTTADIKIPYIDGNNRMELPAGEIHEFFFQALDGSGQPHCVGGDYFELDLSGERWKSRPPVKDMGNGTYAFSLQVHPDFAGDYNLTIILLFRHYEGLKFSPPRFVVDKVLRVVHVTFVELGSRLLEIGQCKKSDFGRDVWSGRWTRHARNDSCPIGNDGRYRCQEPGFSCQQPWCDGPLGMLESNGWVYSAHCSFKLFKSDEVWSCLSGHWIFWWGDSNHCDTIRNMLNFILGVHDIDTIPRIFDMNVSNPRDPTQMVRFTSIFNGHWNHTQNYQGLNSLRNAGYRETLKGYFSDDVVPDTIIMNSGLHDGVYWPNIRRFVGGAEYAATFWAEVMEGVKTRGLVPPEVIYRTTITTGGYARSLAFNPQKMETFNGVVLDKLRQHGILGRVIDDFDMTYPWHFDNRCNDGVHYGRAPLKAKWRDGQIGHQYFVDLMLGHVLINALCTDKSGTNTLMT